MNINKQHYWRWSVVVVTLLLTCSITAQTNLQRKTNAQQLTTQQKIENRMLELNKLFAIYKNKAIEYEELGLQSGTNKAFVIVAEHLNGYEESHRTTEYYYDIVTGDKKTEARRLYLIRFKDAQTRMTYTEDYLFDPKTGLVIYVNISEYNYNTNNTTHRTLYLDKEGKTIIRMTDNNTTIDNPADVKLFQYVIRARELAEVFTRL